MLNGCAECYLRLLTFVSRVLVLGIELLKPWTHCWSMLQTSRDELFNSFTNFNLANHQVDMSHVTCPFC